MASFGGTDASLAGLRYAPGAGRAHRRFLPGGSAIGSRLSFALRGGPGVLPEILSCASAAGSLEAVGGCEAPILWLPPRLAAGGRGADSRRTACVYRGAQGAVDCSDRDGAERSAECRDQNE